MNFKRYHDEEIWKEIELKTPFSDRFCLYISNYGHVKKINKITNKETLLSQPKTEGYPSFNITYLPPIAAEEQQYFARLKESIAVLKKDIKITVKELTKCDGRDAKFYKLSKKLEENQTLLETIQSNYRTNYKKAERKRKLIFGGLTHRFVAKAFLEAPLSSDHKFVAHLDFEKENNHHSNLKWMTQKENTAHQQNSPYVIKAKAVAVIVPRITRQKLTIHQVMVIKKRINEEVPLRKLAKRYKVSETQLLRIKRGINWANVPAAR